MILIIPQLFLCRLALSNDGGENQTLFIFAIIGSVVIIVSRVPSVLLT